VDASTIPAAIAILDLHRVPSREAAGLDRSLADLVTAHALASPDAIAIEDGDATFTYAELDAAGAAIASALLQAGVEDEEPVAICLPRSWQAIASILGTVRAGAAYVPVSPAYPPERQRELLELASARVALTRADESHGLPPEVRRLDAEALATAGGTAPIASGGDRLAYVLFTSGSTGRPKGVEVTHGNLVHLLRSGADVVARSEDTVLHVVPLEFDVSGLEIWGALASGARLVIAPRGRPDPRELGRLIVEREVTFLSVSAGVLHQLVRTALGDLGGLRLITASGDVLSPAVVREVRRAHPGVRILNGYGPTETTILASSFEVDEPPQESVPIGRALPGFRLYVLDDARQPVPPGLPGELWIAGPGVARGYRGDPRRTAERFRPDPFSGGRMYRTGDRVRLRDDGELLFLGRVDRQVKIDGRRVEPAEVERALVAHPLVREAAVVAREDVPGHRRLVGYVVPEGAAQPTSALLRTFVARRLPRFMVPPVIVALAAMPRSERGKVDYRALPPPMRQNSRNGTSPTPLARRVATLMAEVLQLEAVGPEESFFDLGGSSLLAIELVGRIREQLDAQLDIGTVFELPTASALADRIQAAPRRPPGTPALRPGPRRSPAPVSAAQRRAWFFGRLHPDSIAYQFAAELTFEGELDPGALECALAALMGRHEILRTSFEERDGEPVQVIHENVPVPLEQVDGRREWDKRVRSRIDPAQAPLVRWTLVRLGNRRWALLHVEHHLIHDGWSFAVLLGELAELYSACVENRAAELPEPTVQFQDYARWERDLCASEDLARQIRRWTSVLDPDPTLLELPTDRPRPTHESFDGGSVRVRLEPEPAAELAAIARANGATLFMAALAAFGVLLHRYTGEEDVQIGSGVANRREPAAEGLLGMVVNTVVFRLALDGDPTVSELLRRVRRVALDAYVNADAPFDAVVEALRPSRDPSRSPLFNVLFSFHDSPRADEQWAGLDVHVEQMLSNGTAKADLNVVGIDEEGGITFVWEHSDLFADETVERFAAHHLALMAEFASRPEDRLSALELLSADERRELSAWGDRTGVAYERDATIADVFAARVTETPEAIAVSYSRGALAYSALDRRANRLAHRLRSLGVERGTRVSVCLENSLELVVSFLAIAKAGGAYVPLDPRDPPERLRRQAATAGVRLVLTLARHRDGVPAELNRVVCLDDLVDFASEPDEPPAAVSGPLDPAYVMFTSGSTGPPKAVVVPHRAVVRLVRAADYVRLGPGEAVLGMAPPAFDASTFEIWGPLLNGGRLVLSPPWPLTLGELADLLTHEGVTTMWLTAGLFHRVADDRPELFGSLRQLLAGGDVLSPDHVRRALAALPEDAVLVNGYGPTEATTFSCVHVLRPGDEVPDPVPIGRPVPGTSVQILDAEGRSVPVGVKGELFIGGDGLALGYAGGPGLAAERVGPDYRTGDLARWRPDGTIEFLGRTDRQLKIRGFRVEPGEVEQALRTHPSVADAYVTRAGDERGLAAYVAARSTVEPTELRAHVAQVLPSHAVPSAWILVEKLPLTANGKVDTAALPPLSSGGSRPDSARPRDQLERTLAAIWERSLDCDRVGLDDDFFDLGGHSLLAVEVFDAIERSLGRNLPLATIFEAPTVRRLAEALRDDGWKAARKAVVAVTPTGSRPPLFCVCAGDGNAAGFGALARRLGDDQPLFALQPRGLAGRAPLHTSVEAAAEYYLRRIRAVRREGPYLLAGRCLGGFVAYELARRLEAEGEPVGLVAVLDSAGPRWRSRLLADGTPFDEVMNLALRRERPDLDPFTPEGTAELLRWLAEPARPEAPAINRYLDEVYRLRSDVRDAYPDLEGDGGDALVAWAWTSGRREHGLFEGLLPGPPTPEAKARAGPSVRERLDGVSREANRRAAEAVDLITAGRRRGAAGRRQRRLREASVRAASRYRAGRYAGVVTLLRSEEYGHQTHLDYWYGLDTGGVVEVPVAGTHRSMLREPDVASLAGRLESLIDDAIAADAAR
jgi:amino acid adenylation domain-containing protein